MLFHCQLHQYRCGTWRSVLSCGVCCCSWPNILDLYSW